MFKFLKGLFGKPTTKFDIKAMVDEAIASGQISVRMLADSISEHGQRITTFQLKYQRFFHAEFMTHRKFGRNASSSRAIPIMTILKQVWNDPAMPMHWGVNQGGMQAKLELTGVKRAMAKAAWKFAGRCACIFAWMLMQLGVHKQVANRILEPWQFIHVVVTSTDYENFSNLRNHDDAQPEIHILAYIIDGLLVNETPTLLAKGEWHLPYITHADALNHDIETLKKVSAARCCRVSYMKHDGTESSVANDLRLCERLVGSEPLHASPFEHQATPDTFDARTGMWKTPAMHANLNGWNQHRKYIETEIWMNKHVL